MSGEVLLTQRGELVQELILVARDRFFDMITQIYNKTKKKSPKKEYLLRNFQDELEEIPEWTPDDVFAESNPSFREVKREVTGLLTTIHDLNNQLFPQSSVHSVDNRTHDTEQDHFQRFVKMAMIHIAREFWKMPYLMHSFHDKNLFTIKPEIDKIIVQAIKTTIRRQSTLTIVYEPERSQNAAAVQPPAAPQPAPPVPPVPEISPPVSIAPIESVEQKKVDQSSLITEQEPRVPETLSVTAPEQEPRVSETFSVTAPVEQPIEQQNEQYTENPSAVQTLGTRESSEENRQEPWQEPVKNIETDSDSDVSSISTRSNSSVGSDASDKHKKKASLNASTSQESADEKDAKNMDDESQKVTKPFSKQEENEEEKKGEKTIPLDILKKVMEGVVSQKKEKRRIKKPKKMKKKGKGEKRIKEKKRPVSEADLKKYEKFFDHVDNV